MEAHSQFYTATEIATILKISRALAYRLIAEGEIASVRFGRTVRVNEAALQQFFARKAAGTETSGLAMSQPRS